MKRKLLVLILLLLIFPSALAACKTAGRDEIVVDSVEAGGTGTAVVMAPSECPPPVANSTLYNNDTMGYCLVLPASYAILEASSDETVNTMVFYVDTVQDTSHPQLSVKVTDAKGRSLEKISDAYEKEIEKNVPGYDVHWSSGHMLAGQPANQFDQVPGQDLSREVLMVYDGRLFTLTFTPDDPSAGAINEEMQVLYNMVTESFSLFSPQ